MKAAAASLLNTMIKQCNGSQYVIPVYQRTYTWQSNDQVKKLLDDMENLLRAPDKEHFVGTMVYVVTSDGFSVQERSVVDGQQRLTTIFLMLYALRDIADKQKKSDVSQNISSVYLENANLEGSKRLRLKPLVSDDDVFEKIVTKKVHDAKDKRSPVYVNYEYIKRRLQKFFESGYDFDAIHSALNRFTVVYIILDSGDNAQQIFESINSTGVPLTSADLIRNFVLMNKSSEVQEKMVQPKFLCGTIRTQ